MKLKYKVARYCFRCYKRLRISDVKGYSYVCLNCDENFWNFETIDENKAKTLIKSEVNYYE